MSADIGGRCFRGGSQPLFEYELGRRLFLGIRFSQQHRNVQPALPALIYRIPNHRKHTLTRIAEENDSPDRGSIVRDDVA